MKPIARPLWIARVAGTQAEMGRQHGELIARAGGADATVNHYRDLPALLLGGDVPAPLRPVAGAAIRGLSEALLARLEAARPAPFVERSRAFLAAIGRPASWSRYLAVMDLFQNYVGTAARWGLGPFARPAQRDTALARLLAKLPGSARARAVMAAAAQPACSTAIVWGAASADGALRHARNFDFPGIGVWDAAPAMVLCHPDRGQPYGFVTTRGGDTPVVTVWNQAGLVFTTHTRFHQRVSFAGATIVDLVHDLAARAETLADAERIARERPVASTWGIAVSSWRERRAIALEIHAGAVASVAPGPGSDRLIVANRYRDRAMQDGEVTATPAWALHSERRELRLAQLVAEAADRGGATAEDLRAMLVDRVDPDAPGVERQLGGVLAQPCQVHSIVVEPASQTLLLGAAAAPVGEGRWLRIGWSWDGAPGAWELEAAVHGAGTAVAGVVPGTPPPSLGVTVVDAGALPRHPASDAVAEALAIDQSSHDHAAMADALGRAIAAAPGDPSLRLGMTWTLLRLRRWSDAMEAARAGLAHETLPYPRGQLLLWGARAATAAGDRAQASQWRAELGGLGGADLERLRRAAADDERTPDRAIRRAPPANLFMLEAEI